jgi:purine-nucleoside phosphorylase
MLELAEQIDAVKRFIASRWSLSPKAGIILGTGLGGFAQQISIDVEIPYGEIPHLPQSTAIGHKGQLICGCIGDNPVIAMQGRFHLYEGYSPTLATLPVRVMRQLGAELLIVSNASGGLNPAYASGDIMLIDDQMNLMFRNPLIGINDDQLGPRFPDMCRPYDVGLIESAMEASRQFGFTCHRGVYAALSGPTYETRAEYRMLRRLGADVVGMSTVPETLVAVHAGMRILGLSAVTNLCRPDKLEATDGYEVKAAAETAEPKMRQIVQHVVSQL